jgi:hypothetical protein
MPLVLLDRLPDEAERFWRRANREVLWGWKRDVGPEKRLVYFSGALARRGNAVVLQRRFLLYWTVVSTGSSGPLLAALHRVRERFGDEAALRVEGAGGRQRLELRLGAPTPEDLDRTRRLKLRRARRRIPEPTLPAPAEGDPPRPLFPADLYVGSGLSYEAGLPTLCDMHEVFCVDRHDAAGFTVGSDDELPAQLANEGEARLRKFCQVHVGALVATPTPAMETIGRLMRAGVVRRLFTDNVDNLLAKVGVPFERVRGSGVFNERHEVRFESPTLVVVGVAADRRQIVRQARVRGLDVVVVNPCARVSPNVLHLDYVQPQDLFYRTTADAFFAQCVNGAAAVGHRVAR